jgi:hypothetical protein
MGNALPSTFNHRFALYLLLGFCSLCILAILISACNNSEPVQTPSVITTTATDGLTPAISTATEVSPTRLPPPTSTPGPSPTSTALARLAPHTWFAKPIMVEVVQIEGASTDPFNYMPLFVLYGDGLLLKRTCQASDCQYLQIRLERTDLCRLVNSIDRTGFLHADPLAFAVPGETGAAIRLVVNVYTENTAQIPNLDRWVEAPQWYGTSTGRPGYTNAPLIDPAFIELYRLLITYPDDDMTVYVPERLAVSLAQPVIAGDALPWSSERISLAEIAELTTCADNPNREAAMIFEGASALSISSALTQGDALLPLFSENEAVWQVHSHWLLPHEYPQTCDKEAGLYPPASPLEITWVCVPEFGVIPTATSTVTPTPTITPTPLR